MTSSLPNMAGAQGRRLAALYGALGATTQPHPHPQGRRCTEVSLASAEADTEVSVVAMEELVEEYAR
eukprot:COSAG02_NODE_23949_length_702_cov_47.945274_1_plen_66_part_10